VWLGWLASASAVSMGSNAMKTLQERMREIARQQSPRLDMISCEQIRKAADAIDELVEALEIIAGERQCLDNLMSNCDVARAVLAKYSATP
jgi:hypothetical protein